MAFLAASKLSIKGTSCMMTSHLVLSCRASFSPAYNTTCNVDIVCCGWWGFCRGVGGSGGRGFFDVSVKDHMIDSVVVRAL